MSEKCDSHDDCFKRLYGKVEAIDDKIDNLFNKLHTRLHEGDLRFVQIEMQIEQMKQQFEMRLVQITQQFEMRQAQMEKTLSALLASKTDIKQRALGIAFDVVKLGVMGIIGAAGWAFANGYKG